MAFTSEHIVQIFTRRVVRRSAQEHNQVFTNRHLCVDDAVEAVAAEIGRIRFQRASRGPE
jgi:hypothetical protein